MVRTLAKSPDIFMVRLVTAAALLMPLACGPRVPMSETKVIGGRPADDHRFMAGISFDGTESLGCGGTFVAPRVVVTAAHCLQDPQEFPRLKVRPGSGAAGSAPLLDVLSVIVHPDFDSNLMQNDVAVLYVEAAPASANVRPISFNHNGAVPRNNANSILTVIGRGNTSSFGSLYEDQLRQADVAVVPQATCAADYDADRITDQVICAGDSARGGTDSCQGDSGGPLVAAIDGQLKLVGIVSWGEGCAQSHNPGVYTRVSSMATWIDDQVSLLTTTVDRVDGAVLDAFVANLCGAALVSNSTIDHTAAGNRAHIGYSYQPSRGFATTAVAPTGSPTARCPLALPGMTGANIAAELRKSPQPVVHVRDGQRHWQAPAVAKLKRIQLTCEDDDLDFTFEKDGLILVEKGDDLYLAVAKWNQPVRSQSATETCEVGSLKAELISQAAHQQASKLVRFTGAEFGDGGNVYELQKIDDSGAGGDSDGLSIRLTVGGVGNQGEDRLQLRNAGSTDVYSWQLGCNFQFSLVDAAGVVHAATPSPASRWAVKFDALEAHGVVRRGDSVTFGLVHGSPLPSQTRCALNDVLLPVQVAAP